MGEFASKGVAGTGLGLGIAGTTLGLLNGGNMGRNGGLLGGLFGNCGGYDDQYISALQSRVTGLEAEKYSDKNTADVYTALRNEFKDMGQQFIKPMAQEIADMRVREAVNAEKLSQLHCAVASLSNTLGSITKTIVPRTVICPEVMQRFNSWVAPTAEAPATQGIVGNISVD